MAAIKLNDSAVVISFDGEVFEIFPERRIHLSQINKIELTTDRQGRHTIRLDSPVSNWGMSVDEKVVPKVNQLIADFQKARVAFRFD